MQIIDTHCHIHESEFAQKYQKPIQQIIDEGRAAGVVSFISVGTSAQSSAEAVDFANAHGTYASLALHPHEVGDKPATTVQKEFAVVKKLAQGSNPRIVAIGECGLDYYYHKETGVREAQKALLRQHIDLALAHKLPLIFHIREAFLDFFEIIDDYAAAGKRITGVVHSFTAGLSELEGALQRGLYIGLNGIMTFTKNKAQLEAAQAVPLDKLVLETDAPFLTPTPFRGTMCELNHIVETAKFLSSLRNESLDTLAMATTRNAKTLFCL